MQIGEYMKVLIGTTNPSKVERFQLLLKDFNIDFLTLNDLNIKTEPEETGQTPKENAVIKAKYYGQFFDYVICNDSGLYFDDISLDDQRQPGLHIRTPKGKRLNDEAMIDYYSQLIHSLGGKVEALYIDGIAVYNQGKVYSFMESYEDMKKKSFYMVEKASSLRQVGWPLDSISINKETNQYFVEEDNENDEIMNKDYQERLIDFFKKSLNI